MADFTHLHVHTEYSLLDGVNRIPALIEKVKNDGQTAVAMTDHGVMYGLAEFWTNAKDAGIKPIIGCEIYVSPGPREERKDMDGIKYYHLVLLAKNKVGFANLVKLISIGHLEGMYYRPRVDKEILKKYSEGIICTSACLAGPLATHILRNEEKQVEEWISFFKNIYPGRFYLELQRNGFEGSDNSNQKFDYDPETISMIKQQMKVNLRLRELAEKYALPLIASSDAHYLNADDKAVQKILFCVKDGLQLNDARAREGYVGTYVKTTKEMCSAFSDDLSPLENTKRIEEEIEKFDIAYDRVQPKYWNRSEDKSTKEELRDQAYEGAKRKYGKMTKELKERIDFELELIHEKGYDDYLLVVSDIMKWAASKGILTGVRGSVAGSVVAYCTDIVGIDPIGWELYFERFLNPQRPSPPDIDLDIQDSRRDEIIEYVKEKYGEVSLAAVAAIGRFKTKAAIRDVARVMGIDLTVADKLSKRVSVLFGKVYTIDKQMEEDKEFKTWIESDPQLMQLADHVRKIEGMSRHMSVHACGYLITPNPITSYIPTQRETGSGTRVITQIEGPWLEKLGLMKFDFLGLRTLTIVSNAIQKIKDTRGVEILFDEIPEDDKKTFELFASGETTGIFQFESPPMRRYLQDLRPESLEDLCFMAAAYRPGPMKYIPDYIKRKHGEQKTQYLTPELEPIVSNTYGFAIYQEQVIKIAVELAGYSMGEADILRRAMGKKIMEVMKQEEKVFKKGVLKNGMSEKIASALWDYLLPFADYGFNKAHAAGYAVLAYRCAYLKKHYPLEFMAALMHSDLNDTDRIVIDMEESERMGFKILPPDINKSFVDFTPEGKKGIRYGIGAIKNCGENVCAAIVKEREAKGDFSSLDELISRVGPKNLSKKALECMIKVGVLDTFGDRDGLLQIMPNLFESIAKTHAQRETGQKGLFDFGKDSDTQSISATPVPKIKSTPDLEKAKWEKELLGNYITTHPLKKYNKYFENPEIMTPRKAKDLPEGSNVKIGGIITEVKEIQTKAGKSMAFVKIESLDSSCEAVVFNRGYEAIKEKIQEFAVWVFEGKTNHRNGSFSLIIDALHDFKDFKNFKKAPTNIIKLDVSKEKKKEKLQKLKDAIIKNPGKTEVKIFFSNGSGEKSVKNVTKSIHLNDDVMNVIAEYMI